MEKLNIHHNLNTFRILYLIKGIITIAFSLFFVFYACFGFILNKTIENAPDSPELPFNFGWIFAIIGGLGMLICVTFGILTLLASKYLKEVKNYNFIFAIAVLNCLTGVLGILLGVFTLVELTKPDVKELFNKNLPHPQ